MFLRIHVSFIIIITESALYKQLISESLKVQNQATVFAASISRKMAAYLQFQYLLR